MDMTKLNYLIRRCTKCGLCNTRTNAVPGEGDFDANIVITGEAPGKNEDEQGRPFVGAAGRELDKILNHINLSRDDVFITNLVKCRPPQNRDPNKEEINTCNIWLEEQLKQLKLYIIVTLGRFSSQSLLGIDKPMGKMRGSIYQISVDGHSPFVIPIMHPAATLYNGSNKELFYKDFELVKQLMI